MNHGRTVFAQLAELLPRRAFDSAVRRYQGDRKVRSLSCMDQLLCMIFAQITGRSSLRETVVCLGALGPRLYHCGIRGRIARSTLADANESRDFRIFRDLALALIASARAEFPTDSDLRRFSAEIYALDATVIDLCLELFPWAKFRRSKAAVKAHVLYDLHTGVPTVMHVTHGKVHEVNILDRLAIECGAYYVMDKGYIDFARFYCIHQAGAFFVTRPKRGMVCRVRERRPVPPDGPVLADQVIVLRGTNSRKDYPETLRRIRYKDPETGKRLTFLTNAMSLSPKTVAMLYRKRWQIELFFKWIKGHLHVKSFFGLTPNAVQTQLWIAVIAFVLVCKLKHRYMLPQEPNEIFHILSVTILEKTPVNEVFSMAQRQIGGGGDRNQLELQYL